MKKVGHAVLRNFLPIRRNFAPQTFLNSTMNVFTIMLESEGKNLLLLMLQRLLKTDTTCWIVGWVSTCSLEEPFQSQLEASGLPKTLGNVANTDPKFLCYPVIECLCQHVFDNVAHAVHLV